MQASSQNNPVEPPLYANAHPADTKHNLFRSPSHPSDISVSHDEEARDANLFSGASGESYQTMSRWHALLAMTTNQLGLGILSLPACLRTLGLIPGIIALFGMGGLTWYTGYELYQFHCAYPQAANIVEMVGVAGGRFWEAFAGFFLVVQILMSCAAASVTLSVAFNSITGHGLCTIGFIGVSCLGCWALCVPRTVKFVAHSGLPCFLSIFVSSLIVIVALGVSRPTLATDMWSPKIELVGHPGFREGFNAWLRILLAYAGNITFPTYMAEMRNSRRDFPFSLGWLFVMSALLYTTVAVAVYCLAGEYTTSPVLGSAPLIPAKVAYGIILPAVFTSGLSSGHVGIKYVFVLVMRRIGAVHQVTSDDWKAWTVWLSCVTIFWVVCFTIANAIPIFDSILSICSASTFVWFCYGVSGVIWLNLNKGRYFRGWRKTVLFILNVLIILMAFFINGVGLWASLSELLETFANGKGVGGAFDCGDNSIL